MPANIIEITSHADVDSLFEESFRRPVALIKHSDSCGISAHILFQLNEVEGDIHMVVIQEHRHLSNEIAERTGHRHQSPQAFVLRDGKAIYHATHYGISPDEIQNRLKN